MHETVARARFAAQNVKKSEGIGAPLEDRVGKSARRDCNCIEGSIRTSQWYKNYKMHQEVTEKYPFQISPQVPVVPHKAVAEVSKIGNL